MARSKKPPSRPDRETSEAPPEAEVVDQETADPAEEAPAPRKPKKKRGANLEVKASGDPEEVRDALGKMNPTPPQAVATETEEEPSDEMGPSDDAIVRLLANPRNKVMVFRTFPKRWNGAKCDIQVDPQGYRCPAAFEDIKQDVFRRFGGKAFVAYIQPVTLSGHSRVLAAIPFENPDTEEPQFEMPSDPNQVVDPRLLPPAPDGGDPTMMPEEDPMAGIERDLKTQMRLKTRRLQLAQLDQQLREFEGTKEEVAAEAKNPARSLEERIALMQMENKMDRQIDAIRSVVEKISIEPAQPQVLPPPPPAPKNTDDAIVRILMAQNQAAEARFNALMAQQTQLLLKMQNGGGKDDLESMLEKVAKFKAVFGEGDSRVKRLEQTLMDIAMERLTDGGGDGDGESDVKFAVKQISPILKNFVDKKLTEPNPEEVPTKEQFKAAVQQESTRVIQDLIRQGKLEIKAQPQGLPAPAPHPQKIGVPAEKKERPKPPPQEEAPKPKEEEAPVEGPPLPDAPDYDRKKAVDFVLDGIVHDIDAGFPEDTFLIGDALDHLDDEILDQLLKVTTGDDLEKVVGPHCTPEKLQTIKERGKNPRVKTWLTRVITTIQDEYRKEVEGAGTDGAPKA